MPVRTVYHAGSDFGLPLAHSPRLRYSVTSGLNRRGQGAAVDDYIVYAQDGVTILYIITYGPEWDGLVALAASR